MEFKICIFGMGNILLSDDGFGSIFAQKYKKEIEDIAPDLIHVYDMGAHDFDGLMYLENCTHLYFIDIIKLNGVQDGVILMNQEELLENPKSAVIMSTHSGGIQEILNTAEWMGILPENIKLIGAQPENLETGMGLSAKMENMLLPVYKYLYRELDSIISSK